MLKQDLSKVLRTTKQHLAKLEAIMSARTNLSHNAAPLLTIEALMVLLK